MKACVGSGSIDPRILDLSSIGVVSLTPQPPYSPIKIIWYSLDRRLGGPRTGLDNVKMRKILPILRLEPRLLAIQLVASRYTDFTVPVIDSKAVNLLISFLDIC
jgi:hypothetical protein